jgi:hypothetical protein
MNDGKYTGECVDCFFQDAKSGALQIVMRIKVGDKEMSHYQGIITKDGAENPYGVKLLQEVMQIEWNGPDRAATIDAVESFTGPVRVVIATEQGQDGQYRQRIKYVNPASFDGGGGAAGRLSKDQLLARFGKPEPKPIDAEQEDNLPF